MTNTELNTCLQEVLKDENGDTITPSCGIEKLLCLLCESIPSGGGSTGDTEAITTDEIDEIMSQ